MLDCLLEINPIGEEVMSVSHILGVKGRAVITAVPHEHVQDTAQKLAKNRIGALIVVDDKGGIVGIVSERDIVRALAEQGASAMKQPVSAIMSKAVKTCKPGDSETDLMTLMTTNRIRHLPVVEGGKLAGMISIGDIVKFRIEAIEREAEEMKSYISSAG
jgi:CBS domain-containing protein